MTKTVKVRVAVAMDSKGNWICTSDNKQCDIEEYARGYFEDSPYQISFITAEIPIPEPQEIAAEVEKADERIQTRSNAF